MRSRIHILLLIAGGLFAGHLGGSSVWAKPAGFCVECHSGQWLNAGHGSRWADGRSVYQAKLEPCPGLRSLGEEIYFTERRIVQVHQVLDAVEKEGWGAATLRKAAAENAFSFARQKQGEPTSTAAWAKDSSAIRVSLQKIYDQTVRMRDESSRRWLIGLGCLVFILVLALFWVALRKWHCWGKGVILVLVGLGMGLNGSACSTSVTDPSKKSPAQERVDAALAVFSRESGRMDEAFYQSVILAEMARDWAKLETQPAEKAFQLSWDMAYSARKKGEDHTRSKELLGRWSDEGAARKDQVSWDTVLDLRDELRSMEARTWALRAVAEQWMQVNGAKGRSVLERTTQEAMAIRDPEFRDLELRAIAQTWSSIDPARSLEVSHSITNPYLKAVSLTDFALAGQGKTSPAAIKVLLQEAWKLAETIPVPYVQIKARIKIAATGAAMFPQEKESWATRSFQEVQNIKGPELQAMAQQEMVARWASLDAGMAERWAAGIPLSQPTSRAYALLQLSRGKGLPKDKATVLLKGAMAEASKVDDGFEAQKIKSLALIDLAGLSPGETIRRILDVKDPYFRSKILGRMAELSAATDLPKALEWAAKIPMEGVRHGAIVNLIRQRVEEDQRKVTSLYQEAFQSASQISEPFARTLLLIDLAKNWGQVERGKESAVLDWALKSAERISSPGLKGEAQEMLAEAYKDSDKRKAQALRGEIAASSIRTRKTLDEVRWLAKAEPERAYHMAKSLSADFPVEKAMALREAAGGMKSSEPAIALEALDGALHLALGLPESPRKQKIISQIITDAAGLNKGKTLERIRKIPDWRKRDPLLKDAGTVWAGKDPGWAMKAALEIAESSSRGPLYLKIAEEAAKQIQADPRKEIPVYLVAFGEGRARVKREESQAIPFYTKALEGIEKLSDAKERSNLLSVLAAEWAVVDETKALQVAQKIPAGSLEPLSYALMKVGSQLGKWNRKEAEGILGHALAAADSISDPSLKSKRLSQLSKAYYASDKEKGKIILQKAFDATQGDARRDKTFDPVLYEILAAQIAWGGKIGSTGVEEASAKAWAFLEGGKNQSRQYKEEDLKPLERAWQIAQTNKNSYLMGEVSNTWMQVDPEKGLELLAQVDSREIKVMKLRELGRKKSALNKADAARFLDLASQEAQKIEALSGQIQALRLIAKDYAEIDKEKAKGTYLQAYRAAERAYLTLPKF